MAPMSAETKARLREAALAKRQKNPKAKDYEVADWLVMCDYVSDEHPELELPADYFDGNGYGRTLRYVPKPVIEALGTRLPSVLICYGIGIGGTRETRCFPSAFLYQVLKALHLDVDKYSTIAEPKFIAAARTDKEIGS